MAVTPHDGSGTVLNWKTLSAGTGANYTVTAITYSLADPATDNKIDVSHLGQTVGNSILTMDRPLTGTASDTGREIAIEYQGKDVFADAVSGTLTITVGGVEFLAKNSTVSQSSVTMAVNDIIKGTATFKVAR